MNAADDGEGSHEPLIPGAPGLPLSAPVADSVLPPRQFDVPRPSPAERDGAGLRFRADPPASRPEAPPLPGPMASWPGQHPPLSGPAASWSGPAAPAAGPPRYQAPPPSAPGLGDSTPGPQETARAPWGRGAPPSGAAGGRPGGPAEDPHRARVRSQLDELRARAAKASSWQETSRHYARLVNRDGVVPVTVRLSADDVEFLGQAREEVLGFAELGLRLLELHAPLDAGGISTDPSSPILRCRSCMWRWPCPTFRMLTEALSHLTGSGPPHGR